MFRVKLGWRLQQEVETATELRAVSLAILLAS
jgi:hypothetical protein